MLEEKEGWLGRASLLLLLYAGPTWVPRLRRDRTSDSQRERVPRGGGTKCGSLDHSGLKIGSAINPSVPGVSSSVKMD